MPQIIRVIQCNMCRTFQCDIVKKDNRFTCKLCGSRQSLMTEILRGTGRECRMQCMKLNNQRMENDQGFNDLSPQDLMNESYKSDFDSSLMSNKSIESISSPLPNNHSISDTITTETSTGSGWSEFMEEDESFGLTANDTIPDHKRKHSIAVTPQKDSREYKRPRPFTHIQAESSNFNPFQQSCPKTLPLQKLDKEIRAQFKYQHLMDATASCDQNAIFHASIGGDENNKNGVDDPPMVPPLHHTIYNNKTNSFTNQSNETSNSSTSIWNTFLDTETME